MKNKLTAFTISAIILTVMTGCTETKKIQLSGIRVKLEIRNLSNKNFVERREVGIGDVFQLGDTDYGAELKAVYPDFYFDRKKKQAGTRSENMNNPAIAIEISLNEKSEGEVWVFPHFMEHGKRPGGFVFRILSITGADGRKMWKNKMSEGK